MATQVKVRLKASEVSVLLQDTETIKFDKNTPNLIRTTGAKLYFRGKGWWRVRGYAWDGYDTTKSLDLINEIKDRRFAMAFTQEEQDRLDEVGTFSRTIFDDHMTVEEAHAAYDAPHNGPRYPDYDVVGDIPF